ncbi:MAG TPA: hypothetical protein VKM35_06135 [Arenimonas sp.]|uniref:hypothetical protein n=1 Tax=Arenimonas sp. TaxID=1872635 RepID=UPI002C2256EA|nr:hypothetical protein [Arenimonas sp.]HMB56770.1 hypothetical protein [Arenimonas sp.]
MKQAHFRALLALGLLLPGFAASAQQTTGTLVVDIPAFTSEITLKPKIKSQLDSGGLEWGQTGDRIVFTLLNKRFVNLKFKTSAK